MKMGVCVRDGGGEEEKEREREREREEREREKRVGDRESLRIIQGLKGNKQTTS